MPIITQSTKRANVHTTRQRASSHILYFINPTTRGNTVPIPPLAAWFRQLCDCARGAQMFNDEYECRIIIIICLNQLHSSGVCLCVCVYLCLAACYTNTSLSSRMTHTIPAYTLRQTTERRFQPRPRCPNQAEAMRSRFPPHHNNAFCLFGRRVTLPMWTARVRCYSMFWSSRGQEQRAVDE